MSKLKKIKELEENGERIVLFSQEDGAGNDRVYKVSEKDKRPVELTGDKAIIPGFIVRHIAFADPIMGITLDDGSVISWEALEWIEYEEELRGVKYVVKNRLTIQFEPLVFELLKNMSEKQNITG